MTTTRSRAHPSPHRHIRAEVLVRLLERGTPVSADVVDDAIAAGESVSGRPPGEWDATDVEALAWFGLLDHAITAGVALEELARAAIAVVEVVDPDDRRGLVSTLVGLVGGGLGAEATSRSRQDLVAAIPTR